MPRSLQVTFSLLLLAVLVGVPRWYTSYRDHRLRNFRVVQEGVLYRSGQMSLEGLRSTIEQRGIKTVVNLRDGLSGLDQAEEAFCLSRGLRYVRIVQKPWGADDGSVPNEANVKRFLAVMKDAKNYPVLLHCFAGHHRTGAYCAAYRMEFQDWSHGEAIREMYHLGYRTIETDEDVYSYLKTYRKLLN